MCSIPACQIVTCLSPCQGSAHACACLATNANQSLHATPRATLSLPQIFFACMCSILTLNLSRSAGKALLGKGSFGWFDKEVTFEVGRQSRTGSFAMSSVDGTAQCVDSSPVWRG